MEAKMDVVSDHVTDASLRLGVSLEQVFYKAAESCRHGEGFTNNGAVGMKWYETWKRSGYQALPPACQQFILETCDQPKYDGYRSVRTVQNFDIPPRE